MVGNRDPVLRTSRDGNRMSRLLYIPPRALRGCGVDLSRALCPKRAPVLGSAALVLRRSTVLSDPECLVGVGSKIRSSLLSILSLDTHDARAPSCPRSRFVGGLSAMRCRRREGMLPG